MGALRAPRARGSRFGAGVMAARAAVQRPSRPGDPKRSAGAATWATIAPAVTVPSAAGSARQSAETIFGRVLEAAVRGAEVRRLPAGAAGRPPCAARPVCRPARCGRSPGRRGQGPGPGDQECRQRPRVGSGGRAVEASAGPTSSRRDGPPPAGDLLENRSSTSVPSPAGTVSQRSASASMIRRPRPLGQSGGGGSGSQSGGRVPGRPWSATRTRLRHPA